MTETLTAEERADIERNQFASQTQRVLRLYDAALAHLAETNAAIDKWHAWHDMACEERDAALARAEEAETRACCKRCLRD